MRQSLRVGLLSVVILSTMLVRANAVGASSPADGCPSAASGWIAVDRDGWWDRSVQGFINEGIPVYEADGVTYTAAFEEWTIDFGFANAAAFESFLRGEQFAGVDRNSDDLICQKDFWQAPGSPDWLFGIVDNRTAGNNKT